MLVAGKLNYLGVVAGPDAGLVLVGRGGVQRLDQLIDLPRHHHEHLRTDCVDSGECVGGPGGDSQVLTLLENTARVTDENLEAATKHAERFI